MSAPAAPSAGPMASSSTTKILAVVLASLVGLCALIVGALFFMRRIQRERRAKELPGRGRDLEAASPTILHRRSSSISIRTVSTAQSPKHVFTVTETPVLSEKIDVPAKKNALPEIRITFPDEVDNTGKRSPGRIVSVRISENGSEGFEPYDEKLHSYQRDSNDRFHSLDLERIGGLREKEAVAKA